MPLKNIELRHGSRCDSWVWRIIIPANKKMAYRPKLCWVNKKPFTVGEVLYFYHVKGDFPFKEERSVFVHGKISVLKKNRCPMNDIQYTC